MANALKKIITEAKRLKRGNPNKFSSSKKPWKKYVQWASERYKSGAIGQHKVTVKKVTKVKSVGKKRKKRPARKKAGAVAKAVGTVKRRRSVKRAVVKRRRVGNTGGGGGNNTMLYLGLGALALGAIYLFTKDNSPTQLPANAPPLQLTTNPVRNNQAQEILQYAMYAGLAVGTILKLINSLNSKSDSEVQSGYNQVQQSGQLPSNWV